MSDREADLSLHHSGGGIGGKTGRDRILSVVHDAAARILSAGDWQGNVQRMLAEIGSAIRVSRVVLSRNTIIGQARYDQEDLFECDAPGVTRVLDNANLPLLPIKDDAFQDWRERRSRGEVVQGLTRELPDDMRRWFGVQGVLSVMRVPVFVGTEWWGTIGFDQCDRERVWNATEIESLRTAAALVGVAIEHDRSRDALLASEAEAARKAAFLEAVLESVAQGVNVVDANLTFQQANSRYPEMYDIPLELCRPGTPVAEIIRYRWRSGTPAPGSKAQDEEAYVAEQLARWRSSFARNPELRIEETRPDGRVFDVRRRPLCDGGFVTTVTDISDRKSAETEIARQREALHQSEKLTALGSLLAGVAHELNNPLSVVVSQALLMQETAADPRIAQRAEKIQAAADRCSRIVKSFLAIARQRPAARSVVRLRSLLRTALDLTSYGLSSNGIQVELDAPDDVPDIWADGDQLVQVFMNLIVNAQQVLQEVQGPRRLRLAVRRDGPDHVRVTVSDNGPGIPPEIRPRIFEPFFTTKPVGSGTGMGLSLCLGMIGAHKGAITLEDTPGGGATFVVRLPRGSPEDSVALPETAMVEARKKRILIVDDEPEIAEMLAEIVAPLADEVEVAGNGAQALHRLTAIDYDLVISDLRMPELDGPGLYRSLRQRPGGFSGRILFVSGDTLGHNLASFLKESGCPFLEKPFTPAEVRRRVGEMIDAPRI